MKRIVIAAVPLLLIALPAAGHTGHEADGLGAGLLHPLAGADHLLAMVMVGLWAALLAAREQHAGWLLPAAFLAALLAGALAGFAGIPVPFVESGIAATVVALGGMLLATLRAPPVVGIGVVAAAGLVHGVAHGAELPASATPALYAAGFLATTALLHAAGVAVGGRLLRHGGLRAMRAIGAAGTLAGLVMTIG
jgi:urease accessory protein